MDKPDIKKRGRFAHYLHGNKASQIPSNVVWFDTETKPKVDADGREHHYLWFGYACYQRRTKETRWEPGQWCRFESIDAFWEWVIARCRKQTRLYLFSHNGGFDLPVVDAFIKLPEYGFKLTSAIVDDPPIILTWKKDGMTIRFVDTLNIWQLPLEVVGESIGVKKLPMPVASASPEKWDAYGKQDVEVIRQVCLAWFEFIRTNDFGGFSPTLASQAFNTYRHRFMKYPIFIDANEKAIDMSRKAYVGGRVECFKIGTYRGKFYYIDVNSMYPSVMQSGLFPSRLVGVYVRPSKVEIEQWLKDWCMIVECDIDTDQPAYPIIDNKKLIFPVGQFRVHLAKPEFEHAYRSGHVRKIHRVALYDASPLFKDYVDHIYALKLAAKQAGNEVQVWFYKRLLNALYGKFGQRGRVYETVDTCDPREVGVDIEINAETREVEHYRFFGGIVQKLRTEGESRDSFPAIAAHVTSYARLKLWLAKKQAGAENVYYCDTDSMVVSEQGFANLRCEIRSNTLGMWSVERELTDITLHGAKDYQFGTIVRTKGVRPSALWTDRNTVEQDHFIGIKGLMQLGTLSAPIVYKQTKHLKRIYSKGRVDPLGNVTPWNFPGDRVGD